MTNLLPLESFRSAFSYHPWHWNQLTSAAWFPVSSDCLDLIYKYAWQANDSVGREDVLRAIESAEHKLQDWLGYSVAPHFVTETINPERWFDRKLNRVMYSDTSGRWLNVQLGEGKIKQAGIETRTLLGTPTVAGGFVVFSDADGDGLNDTFTITMGTTITDVSQIELMFAAGDRWTSEPASDKWVIAPINVSIVGGIATIKGRLWQIVRPVLYESSAAINPADSTVYAQSIEVYRHYCDPTGTTTSTAQAMLIWETQPWPYFVAPIISSITPNSTDPAALGYALARVTMRDTERGVIGIGEAVWDTTGNQFKAVTMTNFRPPDRIEVRYLAGDDLDSMGHMQDRWARIVAHFAAAELGKRVCACNSANRAIYEQQVDRAFGGDARVEKFNMTSGDEASPFGYKEGQLEAWRSVRQLRQMVGVIG